MLGIELVLSVCTKKKKITLLAVLLLHSQSKNQPYKRFYKSDLQGLSTVNRKFALHTVNLGLIWLDPWNFIYSPYPPEQFLNRKSRVCPEKKHVWFKKKTKQKKCASQNNDMSNYWHDMFFNFDIFQKWYRKLNKIITCLWVKIIHNIKINLPTKLYVIVKA